MYLHYFLGYLFCYFLGYFVLKALAEAMACDLSKPTICIGPQAPVLSHSYLTAQANE